MRCNAVRRRNSPSAITGAALNFALARPAPTQRSISVASGFGLRKGVVSETRDSLLLSTPDEVGLGVLSTIAGDVAVSGLVGLVGLSAALTVSSGRMINPTKHRSTRDITRTHLQTPPAGNSSCGPTVVLSKMAVSSWSLLSAVTRGNFRAPGRAAVFNETGRSGTSGQPG